MRPTTFAECMDVFDRFDSGMYDYLSHIYLSKLDAAERLARTLPHLIDYAAELIAAHADTETESLCKPA